MLLQIYEIVVNVVATQKSLMNSSVLRTACTKPNVTELMNVSNLNEEKLEELVYLLVFFRSARSVK